MKVTIHWNRIFGLLLAIIVVFIAIICFKLINKSSQFDHQDIGQCDMHEAQEIIDNLCELYSLGQVTGSQCSSLCNNNATIKLAQCLSLSDSKIVLLMSMNTSSYVVLKSKRRYFDRQHTDLLFHDPIVSIPSALKTFYDIINSTLEGHMGSSITNLTHEHLIRRLFRHDRIENSVILLEKFDDVIVKYNDYYEHNLALSLTTELNTLFSLMTQHEFLLSNYYRSKHELMPKILGWCGHTYLTEHLTPLNHPMIEEQLYSDTWIPKAWLTNRLLQLVDSFDNELHAPLHLCDFQLSNLGISENGNIKLLDSDMAYFDRLIPLYPPDKCRKHSDCSYFDCSGYCDKRTRRCHLKRRINNNLQVLCDKILTKLLKSETIPLRLHDVLLSYVKKCSSPPGRYKRSNELKVGASSRLLRLMQVMLDGELRSANITSTKFCMADESVERFEIERIVDKRYRNNQLEYLIKWRGYPDSQNTWEPSSNIEGEQEADLLAEYEAFNKHQQQKIMNSGSRPAMNTQSPNKRRNDEMINSGLKKRPLGVGNNMQSVHTPTGFERGFEAEKVLGATDSAGELMLLVKWRQSDEADLVPARIVNMRCPSLVIDFYEQHSFWKRLPTLNQST
ncbi:unnamed protein product [Adineta steineri]|uniref:Chromo domain-containing protein n=1 Tax=Adineta steineri TaxID=433720 RepID=A0A819IVJ0_9BILA|nr:unnamed protein product [Adineta steineri]